MILERGALRICRGGVWGEGGVGVGGLHISANHELPDVDIDGVNVALRH